MWITHNFKQNLEYKNWSTNFNKCGYPEAGKSLNGRVFIRPMFLLVHAYTTVGKLGEACDWPIRRAY